MPLANVSSKGQVTLPAQYRKKLGIERPGRVVIEATDDAIVIRPVMDLSALKGFLGKALTREEEREGAARGRRGCRHFQCARFSPAGECAARVLSGPGLRPAGEPAVLSLFFLAPCDEVAGCTAGVLPTICRHGGGRMAASGAY